MTQYVEFAPRNPPPPTGGRWWHYALAIVVAGLLTFWIISAMSPLGGSPLQTKGWKANDFGETDDQKAYNSEASREKRLEEERETR